MSALDCARTRLHYGTVRDLWPEVGYPEKDWASSVPDDVVVSALVAQLGRAHRNAQAHAQRADRAEEKVRRLVDASRSLLAAAGQVSGQLAFDAPDALPFEEDHHAPTC